MSDRNDKVMLTGLVLVVSVAVLLRVKSGAAEAARRCDAGARARLIRRSRY